MSTADEDDRTSGVGPGSSRGHEGGRGDHDTDLGALIEIGSLDALTDAVDHLCHDGRWPAVAELRDRSRAALDRGKQLWPVAAYAEYRLALDAPGAYAAGVLGSQAERFALGPFAEVAAVQHTYAELAPHLADRPEAFAFAHERVARGEDLRAYHPGVDARDPFAMAMVLAPWEPRVAAPIYELTRVRADPPPLPIFGDVVEAAGVERLGAESAALDALRDLVAAWTTQSNGRADAVAVDGSASDAIATLGCRHHRLAAVSAGDAAAWMSWAAGSGGAHGRRRGMAAGRHSMLWALTLVAGFDAGDVEAFDVGFLDELGEAVDTLKFFLWDDGSPATGWNLGLAIDDPSEGLGFALHANDARLDG